MNSKGAVPIIIGLLVLLPLSAVLSAGGEGPSGPQSPDWWGQATPGKEFHIRIPIRVTNPAGEGYAVEVAPVIAELDLGRVLADAGWLTVDRGTRQSLRSFDLDRNSIRVVEMTNLAPTRPGTADGQLVMHDPQRQGDDAFVVPSVVFEGSLRGDASVAFDSRTNPVITVLWFMERQLDPGQDRYYMIYLDSLVNTEHDPAPSHPLEDGRLQNLFASGISRQFYGYVPTAAKASVNVIGLYDDTEITVFTRSGTGPFTPRPSSTAVPNPVSVDRGPPRSIVLASSADAEFRLEADKPFILYQTNQGFTPSTNGRYADDDFIFQARGAPGDRVHFFSAGHQQPTQVVIDPGSIQLTLNDPDTNPFRYSQSPYASGGGQACPPAWSLTPNQVYTARVVSGGPVLMQMGQPGTLSQVPSVTGAPAGKEFWSVARTVDANCANPTSGIWMAAGIDGAVAVRVASDEPERSIDPPGSASNPTPPPRLIAGAPDLGGPFSTTGTTPVERPLRYEFYNGDARMYAGAVPPGAIPNPAGPFFGADLGRDFVGMGPAILMNPYPQAHVEVEVNYTLSGWVRQTFEASLDQSFRLQDRSNTDRVQAFRVQSSKPLFMYSLNTPQNHFAGLPPFLEAEVEGQAEFWGNMLRLRSLDGKDVITTSTIGGTTFTIDLAVQNLGRSEAGGVLSDTARLSAQAPPGWTVDVVPSNVPLFDAKPREVTVTVTVPDDAAPRSSHGITVEARSKANSDIVDRVDILGYIQRSFAVGVWFDFEDNPTKRQERTRSPGEVGQYTIVVKNLGTVADSIQIETSSVRPGWSLRVADETGQEATVLDLGPGESETLRLTVVPPEGLVEGFLLTQIKATSVNEPAVFDGVTAMTTIRSPSELKIETPQLSDLVDPGDEAVFPVIIRNVGQGGAKATFDLQAVAPLGWGSPNLFRVNPVDLARIDITDGPPLALERGEQVSVFLAISSPQDALAKESAGIRLEVTGASGESLEAFFTAVAANHHNVTPDVPPSTTVIDELPAKRTLALSLKNGGNLDEVLDVQPLALPQGWSMNATPPTLVLLRNSSGPLEVNISVPAGSPQGNETLLLGLRSFDGNVREIPLSVEVHPVAGIQLDVPTSAVLVQPGETANRSLLVQNTGNVPVAVRAISQPGDPWNVSATPLFIEPGRSDHLLLDWRVPKTHPDGTTQRVLRVAIDPEKGELPVREETYPLSFASGRADLRIDTWDTRQAPGGRLVDAVIENAGTRSGGSVVVALMADEQLVDEVVLDTIGPGKVSPVSLLAPDGAARALRIAIDPWDEIVELDEGNNGVDVSGAEASKESSAIPLLWLLLMVFLAPVRVRGRGGRGGVA